MVSPLRIKGLESAIYDTNEYVLILIYISGIKQDGIKVLYRILREIHLIDNLKAYMLLGNNVIDSKRIVLDVAENKVYVRSCGITAIITSR